MLQVLHPSQQPRPCSALGCCVHHGQHGSNPAKEGYQYIGRAVDRGAQARLGCNSELILDEFGEKLLEELDYQQEARNIQARARGVRRPQALRSACVQR